MEALRNLFDKQFRKAVDQLKSEHPSLCSSVIYVYPSPDTAEFSILNEDFKPLVKITVHRWAQNGENLNCQGEIKNVEILMKDLLQDALDEGVFTKLKTSLPFKVMLVNDDLESQAELLKIEEEEEPLSENLLEDFDRELNNFYKELMADF